MKQIYLFFVILSPVISFAQSKKQQIIELQLRYDSLISAQNIEKNQYESSLKKMELKYDQQMNKINSLEDSLINMKNEVNNYKNILNKIEIEENNLKRRVSFLRDSIQQTLFYEFDKLMPQLKKDLVPDATKIKTWLEKTVNISYFNEEKYFTPKYIEYISDVPDDITLGMEENPEKLKKEFYSKWSNDFDMTRITIPWAPFGNGGCIKYSFTNSVYLGQINQEFYFNVKMYCDNPKEGLNFVLRVISLGNSYRIANIMSAVKSDWFGLPVELNQENNYFDVENIKGVTYLKKNLNSITFRNGEKIFLATNKSEWLNACSKKIPACCFYNFNPKLENVGLLYNYFAFIDKRNLAPYGFRLINENDELPNNLSINIHGGTLAGEAGEFFGLNEFTLFWTLCTEGIVGVSKYCFWKILPENASIFFQEFPVCQGMFVRCIKE